MSPTTPEQATTLQRVSGSGLAWPLLDAAQARAHEQAARALHPPGTLMARAGLAVARLALALAPAGRHAVVVCGPGDNGGDGLVAARHLLQTGWRVSLHRATGTRAPSADTAGALQAALGAGLMPTPCPEHLPAADLVIDAVLGLGSARAPEGEVAGAIAALAAVDPATPVLAIDLPSGLHPDTGARLGAVAVRASATLCALSLRPGCFTHEGRDHAGTVWLADLGHPATGGRTRLAPAPERPARPHASHKGRFGDVLVVGGAPGMAGAAVLAAEAALAAGAGRVHLTLIDDTARPAARAELMQRPPAWALEGRRLAQSTVVAGCGGGDGIAALLPPLLDHAARLVLDADALNAIAADAALQALLRARAARGQPSLLTPHPLEAARLLGTAAASVQQDRCAAARALAAQTASVVLLKGSGSLVATPDGTVWVNPNGNGALATAGTGDVLAGWAAGHWSTSAATDHARVACAAAWWHGQAADGFAARHPGHPLLAGDLIRAMQRGA